MIKKILKIIGCIVGIVFLALCGLTLFFSTDTGQQWLYTHCISMLEDRLATKVVVKHVGINPFFGELSLYNAEIYDRKMVKMLSVDTLDADINVIGLFKKELGIEGLTLTGAQMILYKERPDTAANYQFVFDAFKNKDTKRDEKNKNPLSLAMNLDEAKITRTSLKWDIYSTPVKGGDTLDANHLDIKDFSIKLEGAMQEKHKFKVQINDMAVKEQKSRIHLTMKEALLNTTEDDSARVKIKGINGRYHNKHVGCGLLTLSFKKDTTAQRGKGAKVHIEKLSYLYNNGKPRKNTGRPNRGWFDPGHLDSEVNADATIINPDKDSIVISIDKMAGIDKGSGLDIKSLKTLLCIKGRQIMLNNTSISLAHTFIKLGPVVLNIGKKVKTADGSKAKPDIKISTFPLYATVRLTDIAKPFAPPLSHFTTPLQLSVKVGGDMKRIVFSDIKISTPDKRLGITANGDLCKVLEKRELCLHFNNISMYANNGIKEQIVNHFAKKVKLKMLRQLAAVGNIKYNGKVDIFYKREDISGKLTCPYGNISFAFTLDGKTKFMTGMMHTDYLDFGKIMNIQNLTIASAKASYSFSIASHRGKRTHNRLPQGWMKATVNGAKFRHLSLNYITADIKSNGAVADGVVRTRKKLIDMSAEFTYKQTDTEQHLDIFPHISLHKNTDAEKAQKAEEKAKRAEEKALRKKQREERKAERRAAKELAAKDTVKRTKNKFSFKNLFKRKSANNK